MMQRPLTSAAAPTTVRIVEGDVRKLHADPAKARALFQLASQFNLLEMVPLQAVDTEYPRRGAPSRTQDGPPCCRSSNLA